MYMYFYTVYTHNQYQDSLMSALSRGGPLGAALEDVRPMFAGGQMMATAILIEIDLRDGHLRWVNAGHPPALHFDGSVTELPRTGPLLGLNQAPYEEAIRPLPERSLLFVHTDGLTEARNEERQLWGEERLRHLLMASARHGAETLVQVIANDVHQYTGGRFGDDATMIAIEIRPEAIE